MISPEEKAVYDEVRQEHIRRSEDHQANLDAERDYQRMIADQRAKDLALIGDLSYYWIADAMNLEIQVLVERYADTNQNGYIGRQEVDGMPVLEEAFVRLKMA